MAAKCPVFDLSATLQSVGTVHSHASHGVLADVLLHLEDERRATGTFHPQRGVDGGSAYALALKGDVHHRTDDLCDFAKIC